MSAHGTSTRLAWRKGLASLTMSGAAVWLAVTATAAPATATDPPAPHSAAGTVATTPQPQGPPNYPNYNPRYEVTLKPFEPVKQGNGQDTGSATMAALGGLALGGAGLGIAIGVQRRRKHTTAHAA